MLAKDELKQLNKSLPKSRQTSCGGSTSGYSSQSLSELDYQVRYNYGDPTTVQKQLSSTHSVESCLNSYRSQTAHQPHYLNAKQLFIVNKNSASRSRQHFSARTSTPTSRFSSYMWNQKFTSSISTIASTSSVASSSYFSFDEPMTMNSNNKKNVNSAPSQASNLYEMLHAKEKFYKANSPIKANAIKQDSSYEGSAMKLIKDLMTYLSKLIVFMFSCLFRVDGDDHDKSAEKVDHRTLAYYNYDQLFRHRCNESHTASTPIRPAPSVLTAARSGSVNSHLVSKTSLASSPSSTATVKIGGDSHRDSEPMHQNSSIYDEEETYDNLPTLKSIASSQNTLNREIQTISTPSILSDQFDIVKYTDLHNFNSVDRNLKRLQSPLSRSSPLITAIARFKAHHRSAHQHFKFCEDMKNEENLYVKISPLELKLRQERDFTRAPVFVHKAGSSFKNGSQSFFSVCSSTKKTRYFAKRHSAFSVCNAEATPSAAQTALLTSTNLNAACNDLNRFSATPYVLASQSSRRVEYSMKPVELRQQQQPAYDDYLCDKEVESYFNCPSFENSNDLAENSAAAGFSKSSSNDVWNLSSAVHPYQHAGNFFLSHQYMCMRKDKSKESIYTASASYSTTSAFSGLRQPEFKMRPIRHGESYC